MIFIRCSNCAFTMRVFGSDSAEMEGLVGPKSEWYPDRYPCPKCGERARTVVLDAKMLANLNVLDLNPQEAFVAFSGGGLPGQGRCGAEVVKRALVGAIVKTVSVRHIKGTERCCLDSITLEDGKTLYLASSVYGAAVYRIAEPHSYVGEALGE